MMPVDQISGSIAGLLGTVFAALVTALAVLIPIGLTIWGLCAFIRRKRGGHSSPAPNDHGQDSDAA